MFGSGCLSVIQMQKCTTPAHPTHAHLLTSLTPSHYTVCGGGGGGGVGGCACERIGPMGVSVVVQWTHGTTNQLRMPHNPLPTREAICEMTSGKDPTSVLHLRQLPNACLPQDVIHIFHNFGGFVSTVCRGTKANNPKQSNSCPCAHQCL